MPNNVFKIIDKNLNKCVNAIILDGISQWQKPSDCEVIQDDNINIHDEVVLINSKWEKIDKNKLDSNSIETVENQITKGE